MEAIDQIFKQRISDEKNHKNLKKHRSEREELVEKFLVRLNALRKQDNYEPLKFIALAVKLKKKRTSDLYGFYKSCEEAGNFGKFFWWSLKPKA